MANDFSDGTTSHTPPLLTPSTPPNSSTPPESKTPPVSPPSPNVKTKKNNGLPWKNAILPIFLWLFCAAELVLLFLIPDAPKTTIPTPILEIKTSHLTLPAPFCPSATKIVEKECPKPTTIPSRTTNFAQPTTPPLRIERLPAKAESPQTLAADFFQKGVRHSLNKEWRAAADAFFKALHFYPDSPESAFNLALSLEHLGDKRQAIFYYEKALQNARNRPANFDKQMLTRHLEILKNNPR